ncbi:MAG: hypothetical protein AVDCRST_MAG77-932 [uncultured Chloroflexi bacterium]|uniref:Glycosyltransferase RgtA/B/C/D-like domain-containing protein n=1 Tax=uncultured Chloroflexota bacterium TaxID=166587 RepID=A0A6J4HRC8_9CHLR|nr:MAG: hypothetical protein AVDCRST_MAG77-932 [uncultured Chloroflexota bacterium]
MARLLVRREPWVVYWSAFAVYAALGWAGAYVIRTYNFDGLARIGQAFAAVFGRQPHLAAIGFVWPPIPVTTDLVLVVLLRPFGLLLLAGPLMSALYGAAALALMDVFLRQFEVARPWRLTWVALCGLHPILLQNATMGLSEAPFLAALLLSLNGFALWERRQEPLGLLVAGIGAALAVWCRYDAVAWLAAGCGALTFCFFLRGEPRWRQSLEAVALTFVMPAVWVLLFWMLLSWQVMGNPIYFLVGPGSTATTPDTARGGPRAPIRVRTPLRGRHDVAAALADPEHGTTAPAGQRGRGRRARAPPPLVGRALPVAGVVHPGVHRL